MISLCRARAANDEDMGQMKSKKACSTTGMGAELRGIDASAFFFYNYSREFENVHLAI
jgi:hypothetical protein